MRQMWAAAFLFVLPRWPIPVTRTGSQPQCSNDLEEKTRSLVKSLSACYVQAIEANGDPKE